MGASRLAVCPDGSSPSARATYGCHNAEPGLTVRLAAPSLQAVVRFVAASAIALCLVWRTSVLRLCAIALVA